MLQLQADLHTHTIASTHAYSTVTEMAQAAAETGLRLMAITDHGPASPDAPHLWHFHNYKILPRRLSGVWLLKGVEANIIDDQGTLDMDEKELSFCEWVVASYHTSCVSFPRESVRITQGYRKICEHPAVDVIGHCTTDAFPCDYRAVLSCCKEYGKLVELNESSIQWKAGAMKNAREVFALCKQMEVPIVVNTDAHFSGLVGKIPLAEQLLSDLAFPHSLIVNLDADRIMELAAKKRGIRFSGAYDN
ncbi:MAG: phosphatase [Oscillospiraceae bacterium]|nr:phosphatase [Oscillospiraceae bacterium]